MYSFTETEMGDGVVTIQEHIYAVGLIWFKANSRKDFSTYSSETQSDFGCKYVLPSKEKYVGFASRGLGHSLDMHSLALTLVDKYDNDFIFVIHSGSVWCVVAVDALGRIVADRFFMTEEEAYSYATLLVEKISFSNVYFPVLWGGEGNSVIDPTKKSKLKKLRFYAPNGFIGIAFLFVFIVLAICLYFYYGGKKDIEAKGIINEANEADIPALDPRRKFTDLKAMVDLCTESIVNNITLALSVPGYELNKTISCNDGKVFFSLKEDSGIEKWMQNKIISKSLNDYFPGAEIRHEENEHKVSLVLPEVHMLNLDDSSCCSCEQFSQNFTLLSEKYGIFAQVFSPEAYLSSKGNTNWRSVNFQFESSLEPKVALSLLTEMGCGNTGLKSITYNYLEDKWLVEGVYFEKVKS